MLANADFSTFSFILPGKMAPYKEEDKSARSRPLHDIGLPISFPFTPVTPMDFSRIFSPLHALNLPSDFACTPSTARDSFHFTFPNHHQVLVSSPAPVPAITKTPQCTNENPQEHDESDTETDQEHATIAVTECFGTRVLDPGYEGTANAAVNADIRQPYTDSSRSSPASSVCGEGQNRESLRKKMEAEHRLARGRQRPHQLAKMTKEERDLEREMIKEKNRQSARDCRVRKKCNIQVMRVKIAEQEIIQATSNATISFLRKENESLLSQLAKLRRSCKGKK